MWLSKFPCYKVTTDIPPLDLDTLRSSFPLGQLRGHFFKCVAVPLGMEQPHNIQESLQHKALIQLH